MKNITLFDLDHTLIPLDSDYAWGQYTLALGWCDAQDFAERNAAFFADYRAGVLDISAYVRFATAAMRRQGAIKSIAARAVFMREIIEKGLRNEALALVENHRKAGDQLAIVTATNAFVTRPIADIFGIADLLAVELAVDAAGDWTGEIAGVPSVREGKVTRVEQWLAAQDLDWNSANITFYSDSLNDLALLERVAQPVATNPDEKLRTIATQRGWRILDLFETN